MGLVVVVIDGDQKAGGIQAVFLGNQVPGQLDRAVLEIVTKGEIAQHFEERVVAGGITHIVQVIVFTPRTHTFLRRGGTPIWPRLGGGEDVLELHHARIGEHQGGIVMGHQGGGVDNFVPRRLKIIQEGLADIVCALHLVGPS